MQNNVDKIVLHRIVDFFESTKDSICEAWVISQFSTAYGSVGICNQLKYCVSFKLYCDVLVLTPEDVLVQSSYHHDSPARTFFKLLWEKPLSSMVS